MMTEEQKQALIARCNYLIGGAPEIDVQLAEFALAALTQPASPALKLPDEISLNSAVAAVSELTHESRVGSFQDGWNACLAEVKRLNAPHTAPIEPICATGGAEWVRVCDGKPDVDVTVWCYGQYDDGSDDTDNYAFPGYMDKKGRWFACNNGDYVDGGYGNDYRACVARWMPLPAAPED